MKTNEIDEGSLYRPDILPVVKALKATQSNDITKHPLSAMPTLWFR